jgi:hypothetical protein
MPAPDGCFARSGLQETVPAGRTFLPGNGGLRYEKNRSGLATQVESGSVGAAATGIRDAEAA